MPTGHWRIKNLKWGTGRAHEQEAPQQRVRRVLIWVMEDALGDADDYTRFRNRGADSVDRAGVEVLHFAAGIGAARR